MCEVDSLYLLVIKHKKMEYTIENIFDQFIFSNNSQSVELGFYMLDTQFDKKEVEAYAEANFGAIARIAKMNWRKLVVAENLDLDNTKITALPAEIGQLQSLQNLYLRNSQITALPAEMKQLHI